MNVIKHQAPIDQDDRYALFTGESATMAFLGKGTHYGYARKCKRDRAHGGGEGFEFWSTNISPMAAPKRLFCRTMKELKDKIATAIEAAAVSTEDQAMERFLDLAIKLSPENLTCDGELKSSAVRTKLRALKEEWDRTEQALGRRVTEDQVWDWYRRQVAALIGCEG